MNHSAHIPATVIRGDGIGPEIVAAALRVLEALGAPFAWDNWLRLVPSLGVLWRY